MYVLNFILWYAFLFQILFWNSRSTIELNIGFEWLFLYIFILPYLHFCFQLLCVEIQIVRNSLLSIDYCFRNIFLSSNTDIWILNGVYFHVCIKYIFIKIHFLENLVTMIWCCEKALQTFIILWADIYELTNFKFKYILIELHFLICFPYKFRKVGSQVPILKFPYLAALSVIWMHLHCIKWSS